ncbi:MAG: SPFH domain-containing protein, partial [Planktomarina sp.]
MAGNNGGPWGGGNRGDQGNNDNGNDNGGNRGGNRPDGPQIPEIDEMVRKGQEQLRVLMGGKGARSGGGGSGGGEGIPKGVFALAALAAVGLWLFSSLYTVKPEEKSVELFLGEFSSVGEPGLNFAPWPVVTYEVVAVTTEQTVEIGIGRAGTDEGLMLTGDENVVDIDFQVVWNINNPQEFLFNLAEPQATIRAVSESVMREIVARTDLT